MSNTTRQQFMARITTALGHEGSPVVPPPPVVRDEVVRLVKPDADVVAVFIERATAVGMFVHRCAEADARDTTVKLLNDLGIRTIVSSVANCPAFDQALFDAGVEQVAWRGDRAMRANYDVDAGATQAEAAIADSGTLVVHGDAESGRGLFLVPPIHIAVLRAADVLADQLDYMRPLRDVVPADLPAGRTFITGPSKTADIEGILVTGVHGPGAVHILLID